MLRFSIDLEVAAGPPVGFDIQVQKLSAPCLVAVPMHTLRFGPQVQSTPCTYAAWKLFDGLALLPHGLRIITQTWCVCVWWLGINAVQGEGRAIALSKSVLLGESLPPLRLVFQDSHGNVVPVGPEGQPTVTLQVLEAGPGNGGAVLQELQAEAELVSTAGCAACFTCWQVCLVCEQAQAVLWR